MRGGAGGALAALSAHPAAMAQAAEGAGVFSHRSARPLSAQGRRRVRGWRPDGGAAVTPSQTSPRVDPRSRRPDPGLEVDLVGGRQVRLLPEAGQARPADHRLAGRRHPGADRARCEMTRPPETERAMSGTIARRFSRRSGRTSSSTSLRSDGGCRCERCSAGVAPARGRPSCASAAASPTDFRTSSASRRRMLRAGGRP